MVGCIWGSMGGRNGGGPWVVGMGVDGWWEWGWMGGGNGGGWVVGMGVDGWWD